MGATTKTVTDASFDADVLGSPKPVLVDFWAEWCSPCRLVTPVLEEIASEHPDEITIAKLNIDENPGVPQQYQVLKIPTLLLFKDGDLIKQIIGAKPKAALLSELEEVL
jgi:thioredoxin 1